MEWDYKNLNLNTFIPEIPRIFNNNNKSLKRFLEIIYNPTQGVIVVPVNTPGRIKGSTGEFVTVITDNLVVKKQWTNLYENVNTIDTDYYYSYVNERDPVRDASTWENSSFKYIDVNKTYYKIKNDVSTAFMTPDLGKEIHILFDTSTLNSFSYKILLDPSYNGSVKAANVSYSAASLTWAKLISVEYDPSWGTTWAIKEYGGTITIN